MEQNVIVTRERFIMSKSGQVEVYKLLPGDSSISFKW